MRQGAELAATLLLLCPVVLAVAAVSVREPESGLVHAFLLSSRTRRTAPSSVAKKSRRLDRAGTPVRRGGIRATSEVVLGETSAADRVAQGSSGEEREESREGRASAGRSAKRRALRGAIRPTRALRETPRAPRPMTPHVPRPGPPPARQSRGSQDDRDMPW